MTINYKCGIIKRVVEQIWVIKMSKIQLEKDFIASQFLSSCPIFGNVPDRMDYGKLFYETNEDLVHPFDEIDFYEKDVLSVLSSGDHVLTARFLEADTVDAFDKNSLTLYYFYLRLWTIQYNHELYPNIMKQDFTWLNDLLKRVRPRNEAEIAAVYFFKRHIAARTNFLNLFFEREEQPKGKLCYRDASELISYTDPKLKFYKADLFQEFPCENRYDIVLLSNILEWAKKDPKKLEIAAENIARVLKKRGIAVSSRLIYRAKAVLEEERKIFSPYFEQEVKGNSVVYYKK